MLPEPSICPGYRFPVAIISYAVRPYRVLGLRLREVEPMPTQCGISVTHESIRPWCRNLGADFAREVRHRPPKPGDTRHFNGVFPKPGGELQYLWRAVDQHGVVLDVRPRRDPMAAGQYRRARAPAFQVWRQETRVRMAA
ncbi:IS6 family transposase [Paracraurococcus ruber]|uniref:Transposase n=1 Tax=Paracraurococcus ruber TaxID=77675 RepID=A0ABS1CV84_9PROT|nr:IS6 family transposase [Paracraurococcus ruber]MBK1658216.1 hypothetical protein [Paracraurococcus ruber]TDG29452.1 IS6 family transposase [Paracraurococcus ruber]